MKDKILEKLINKEIDRQNKTIDLIASENIVSQDILNCLGSPLTNKYSEGYPGKRYYAGNSVIDEIEVLAQTRAKKVFGLGKNWEVNVQALSGSPANLAIYFALLRPGDKIMGLSLPFGGHLTHGWNVNFSGKIFQSVQYKTDKNGLLDYDEIAELAKKENPKIIVAGATAYPKKINFKKFSEIAKSVDAYFLADISHIAGLIAAGVHSSPFPYADVVMTTTHKSLRGPRGSIIFSNNNSAIAKKNNIEMSSAINKAIFPGLQGGPHDNQTAAIAACLYEAMDPNFKKYGIQVIKNSEALAEALKKSGFKLVSNGTDNHLILLDLTNTNISGSKAQEILESAGIITNKNTVPYDSRKPFDPSGLRIGTLSITTRGMKEKEILKIADFITRLLIKKESPKMIKKEIEILCAKFPVTKSQKK